MKIKEVISRYRNDFTARYECEYCGHVHESYGYEDSYFHQEIIPSRKCPKCGKASRDRLNEGGAS